LQNARFSLACAATRVNEDKCQAAVESYSNPGTPNANATLRDLFSKLNPDMKPMGSPYVHFFAAAASLYLRAPPPRHRFESDTRLRYCRDGLYRSASMVCLGVWAPPSVAMYRYRELDMLLTLFIACLSVAGNDETNAVGTTRAQR
jgi:hypothetical protein